MPRPFTFRNSISDEVGLSLPETLHKSRGLEFVAKFICLLGESLCDYLFSKLERGNCCSFAYSTLACFRTGMSGSASFQRVRKSW